MIELKPYTVNGRTVWAQKALGAPTVTSVSTQVSTLASKANALASLVSQKGTPNALGRATASISLTVGTLATLGKFLAPALVAGPVGVVLGAVAAVAGLVATIFGSDQDEETLAEAAQVVAANGEIEQQNYLLDQRAAALKSSIENAIPILQQYTKNLGGLKKRLNGLGLPSAGAQLNSAKSTNQYLKDLQVKKINDLTKLIENFTKVADSIANQNKYLANMKAAQQYGTYASGAAALAALAYGVIKLTKGEKTKGLLGAGGGVALAAAAYYLYTQSQTKEAAVQQGTTALQQYSNIINESAQAAKFPTKNQLFAALQTIQGKYDPAEPAAINASYNEQNGTWRRGDWSFQITSSEPVSYKQVKGGSEVYYTTTSFYVSRNKLSGLSGFQKLLL